VRGEQQQANTKAKRDPAPKIVRGASKVYKDADAAVVDLKSGSTILSAGFGLCGTAGELCSNWRICIENWVLMKIWKSRDDYCSN
jgi:hypothetical protein